MGDYTKQALILSGVKSPNDAGDFANALQHMLSVKGFITVEDVKRLYFITDAPASEIKFTNGEDKVGWTSFKNVNMHRAVGYLDGTNWVVSFPPAKKLFENEMPPFLPTYVPKPKKELSVLYTLAVVFALALEIVICITIVYLALGLL